MSIFKPVGTRRTFEEAVEQIADSIMVGDLHVGDRLPTERALAAQMQISRPTLREAIRLLADAGVLEVKRGGGISVASDYVPRDVIRGRSELRVSEVTAVLEARRLLEPRVAQLAALRADEAHLEAMRQTIVGRRARAAAPDFLANEDRFLQLDMQFHLLMARATQNPTILRLMRSLMRDLEIAFDMAVHAPFEPEWTLDIHQRTLNAIAACDMEQIDAVMDEHLARVEQRWREETGRALARALPDFLHPLARAKGDGASSRRRASQS
jgi:GntR family transcriptional repressor for pyruvate dehydrogenase complex